MSEQPDLMAALEASLSPLSQERSLRRLDRAHALYLDATAARSRAEREEADTRVIYEAERARHDREWGERDG